MGQNAVGNGSYASSFWEQLSQQGQLIRRMLCMLLS